MKKSYGMTDYGSIYTYIYTRDFYERKPIIDKNSIGAANLWLIPILNFDASDLKGKKIKSAVLTLKPQTDSWPLEVEMTSISEPWNGEYATNYAPDRDKKWAGDGWFIDVVLGNGNSVYFREDTVYDEAAGLLKININPRLVYMMANEQSYGIGILDTKSKGYAVCEEDKWQKEGWLAVKRFNVNPDEGPVPVLEVEYEDTETITPLKVWDFKAAPLDDPEVPESTGVLLNWTYDGFKSPADDFGFFEIYMSCEKLPVEQMERVPKYFVPNAKPGESLFSAEITGLKHDTEYWFAVVASNNTAKSQPVYACVRTLPPQQKPMPVIPENIVELKSSKLEADGFKLYIADEIAKFDAVSGSVTGREGSDIEDYETVIFDGEKVKLVCSAGEKACFQVVVRCDEADPEKPAEYGISVVNNTVKGNVLLFKAWYVNENEKWNPEVAVPIDNGRFTVPFAENAVEGQKYQAIYIDIELDNSIEQGVYGFSVELSHAGKKLAIPVEIEITGIQLVKPDFKFELNGYSGTFESVAEMYEDTDVYEIEKEYYIAGYRHGQTVNIVPYRQGGDIKPYNHPKIEFVDGLPRVTDWSVWDEHFEKFLDGSYVEELEGRKVPVTHLYLPIFENWPMPIDEYYKIKVESREYPQLVNEHKLKVTNIYEDFLPVYREGIKSVLKDFIRHIDEKGWKDVTFLYFYNNKHFFKEVNEKKGMKGNGCSWWLLDEPVFREDWRALAFYGSILKEAQRETGSGYNIKFRADLSGYYQMFDSLDGILDLACLGLRIFVAREDLARRRRNKFGEEYWVYGSWNKISQSNMIMVSWVIGAWLKGGTGLIPWNSYGRDENYEKPADIAVFYPGKRFGYKAPLVSLRMKAGRKGLEMLKYLETYKRAMGFSDARMKEITGHFLRLQSRTKISQAFDAGRMEYVENGYDRVEALKRFIISELKKR